NLVNVSNSITSSLFSANKPARRVSCSSDQARASRRATTEKLRPCATCNRGLRLVGRESRGRKSFSRISSAFRCSFLFRVGWACREPARPFVLLEVDSDLREVGNAPAFIQYFETVACIALHRVREFLADFVVGFAEPIEIVLASFACDARHELVAARRESKHWSLLLSATGLISAGFTSGGVGRIRAPRPFRPRCGISRPIRPARP